MKTTEPEYQLSKKEQLLAAVQSEHPNRNEITFLHSSFCQCFIPPKPLPAGTTEYSARHGKVVVEITAGKIYNPQTEEFDQLEIPSGPAARLFLTHISNHVMKYKNTLNMDAARTVPMGEDRTQYLSQYILSNSKAQMTELSRQARNISAMRMQLGVKADNYRARQVNIPQLAESIDFWSSASNPYQLGLWQPTMILSREYVLETWERGVPLDQRAMIGMYKSPVPQDMYVWLSYRLRTANTNGTFVPLFTGETPLRDIFYPGIKNRNAWLQEFNKGLATVQTWYPEAKFSLDRGGRGKAAVIKLYRSPPPVPENSSDLPWNETSIFAAIEKEEKAIKAAKAREKYQNSKKLKAKS